MQLQNSKYLGTPSFLINSLKPIKDAKDPWSKKVSVNNIHLCLNLHVRLKSVKLDEKIETQHLALFEQKYLLTERRSKYYESQVRHC